MSDRAGQRRAAEEEDCGKGTRRIGVVMRRAYQVFRCCPLIKHHQTLNLLTINTLHHYHAFPPPFFPSSLHSCLSLSLSHSLPPSLAPLVSLALYQTPPNIRQINYLMHLPLSARAQSNLPHSPFTEAFSHKKSG